MVELDEEEIQGLIIVREGKDQREISARVTNELIEKGLIGWGLAVCI